MIFIIIIIFFIYYINNNKEYFNNNNIYKEIFLEYINLFNSDQEYDNKYNINIISSSNKKYFELSLENIGFSKLLQNQNTNFRLKKLKEKNTFNIITDNNLLLNYDSKNNIISSKILNLDNSNIFIIDNIENKFFELDYNKFRFIGTLRHNNMFLGENGFTSNIEKLYFDITII